MKTPRRPVCELCRVVTRFEFLESTECFPFAWVCVPCAAELRADEDDSRNGEPECVCRSFCAVCTPGA